MRDYCSGVLIRVHITERYLKYTYGIPDDSDAWAVAKHNANALGDLAIERASLGQAGADGVILIDSCVGNEKQRQFHAPWSMRALIVRLDSDATRREEYRGRASSYWSGAGLPIGRTICPNHSPGGAAFHLRLTEP